jgi:hypothetical protein
MLIIDPVLKGTDGQNIFASDKLTHEKNTNQNRVRVK